MTLALCVVGYFCVGAGCCCYRAYIDPIIRAESRDGFLYSEDYTTSRVAAFLLWPAWVPFFALARASRRFEARGRVRLERLKRIDAERVASEREIERIIREAGL